MMLTNCLVSIHSHGGASSDVALGYTDYRLQPNCSRREIRLTAVSFTDRINDNSGRPIEAYTVSRLPDCVLNRSSRCDRQS